MYIPVHDHLHSLQVFSACFAFLLCKFYMLPPSFHHQHVLLEITNCSILFASPSYRNNLSSHSISLILISFLHIHINMHITVHHFHHHNCHHSPLHHSRHKTFLCHKSSTLQTAGIHQTTSQRQKHQLTL